MLHIYLECMCIYVIYLGYSAWGDPREQVRRKVTTGPDTRLGVSQGVFWVLDIYLGYENKYLEIYLRIECLGGNIGEVYHFALGDVFRTPSLGINLSDLS